MALSARRRGGNGLDAWPGYVDALSTLLMVIIFVLLVFVLAQAFLSAALSRKNASLEKLNVQVTQLSNMLSSEQGHAQTLQLSVTNLGQQLAAAASVRDSLTKQLAALKDSSTKIAADRDRMTALLSNANLKLQSSAKANAAITAKFQATEQQLATAQAQLAAMQQQIAALNKTVSVGRDTIQTKVADLARLQQEVQALAALRDDLRKQVQDASAGLTQEQKKSAALSTQLATAQKNSDSANAQVALLNWQVDQLRNQLKSIAAALDVAQKAGHDKDVQIASLGQKLNMALADKVQELQLYRSEFFGKLRQVLANQKDIRVVGDRFVFQTDVLFPVGSADLTQAGQDQIQGLAQTLKQIIPQIPKGVNWVLSVEGHTDPQPIKPGGQFTSNWDLSTARALNVVKVLIADGIPPERLAAAGFGQYDPIVPGNTPADYAKDRRIEFRLTSR